MLNHKNEKLTFMQCLPPARFCIKHESPHFVPSANTMRKIQILHSVLQMRKLRFTESKKLSSFVQLCHWYPQRSSSEQSTDPCARELARGPRPCCLSDVYTSCGQSKAHALVAKETGGPAPWRLRPGRDDHRLDKNSAEEP